MRLKDLTIEYRKNPLGLDVSPRFSWKLESDRKNVMQHAYRIWVRQENEKDGEGFVWDSGKVESDESVLISYQGETLRPFTRYEVFMNVWDNQGETGEIAAWFETGLLEQVNWQARWITHEFPPGETACPIFTKEYEITKKVARARAYVTSLGVYELCVNGQKAGDMYLSPGWTSYHDRLQYQTYDITGLLSGRAVANGAVADGNGEAVQTKGANPGGAWTAEESDYYAKPSCRIELTVANGWYKGYLNCDGENCFYGDRVAALAMFRVEYEDGTADVFGTDEGWDVTTGIIRESELYHGEIQDFTGENRFGKTVTEKTVTEKTVTEKIVARGGELVAEDGESVADGGNPAWTAGHAVLFDAQEKVTQIVAQESEPVRVTEEVAAREKIITPKGEIVIDFGQNLPGFVKVKLPPLTGDRLVIRHAETLDKEGNFYTTNLRTAKCREVYIYGREQVNEVVAPHFTYRGFRYICLEGVDADVEIDRFTACVLHTDMERAGRFSCDNPKVDRLQENIVWGQRGNFVDIPTDCPQRDERLGWTGDAQIFCRTAMFNYQSALFYRKWLRDVAVETDDEHGVPHIVPNIVGPATGTAVWSDCATIIPWTAYIVYGDKEILREQYANMRQWVEYVRRSCGEDVLWMNGFQRGDWLALDSDESLRLMSGGTDKNLVANVYYACSVKCVRDAAKVLEKWQDARVYGELYDAIVEELNQEYVTRNGRLVSETQTACTLLLYFDLLKEEYRRRVVKILEDNLNQHKGHLTTGFVGTAYLCHVLSENGKHGLAEELLLNEEYPGWLYAINKGATTIWERWNSILPNGDFDESGMNSLNHYTYGSIGDWLYRKVAGINLLAPGYKKILIRPLLTRGITQMDASYETMYGTVEVHLSCRDGQIMVDVKIPANTTAVLELPEQDDEVELGSGSYHFAYETKTDLCAGKITMNSTLLQVLALPGGEDAFVEVTGRPLEPSMRNYLQEKTLSQLAAMMPGGERMISAVYEKVKTLTA